ncbi:hypothetical protein EON81_14460 [bacterium]|nr:MAG: hypothetical protein EON81_14460 [bacterium]
MLFVRGAWDARSFTEAFRLVTSVPPSEPMPLESLLSTLTGGPLGDFRSGVYSRGAIEGIAPDAAKWLDKHGVPAGARMECRPALQFHLYGDARPDGNGNFTRDASVFLVR